MTVLVLTNKRVLKKTNLRDIKKRNIKFKNWFCPIAKNAVSFSVDGNAMSGVCGNLRISTDTSPWWTKFDEIKNLLHNASNNCRISICSCGSDLLAYKSIDQETYDLFVEKANSVQDYTTLSSLTKKDEVIALGGANKNLDFTLTLDYTKRCNYDCIYCSPFVHNNYGNFLSLEKIKKLFECLEFKSMSNYKLNLIITGGEPTLSKELIKLVDLCYEYGFSHITINSNGTAPSALYEKLLEKNVFFIITLHEEFANKKLIEKVYKIYKENYSKVQVDMLGDDKNNRIFWNLVKSVFGLDFDSIKKQHIYYNKRIVNSIEKIKLLKARQL